MISTSNYRKAFFSALALHVFLVVMLLSDSTTQRPVLTKESENTPGLEQPLAAAEPQQEIVKAVSVDSKEIMETVTRLKQERAQKERAELNRQNELNRQVESAKRERIKETNEAIINKIITDFTTSPA